MPSKLAVNTRLIVIFGLMCAPALSACSAASGQSRYASGPCTACAQMPVQNLCCYAPPPVIYIPPQAPVTVAPTVYVEPEPEPTIHIEPYVEPPIVYTPPPTVVMSYPEPSAPIPHRLPARK